MGLAARFKRGDIYWFDPSPVIGSEVDKIRPCVIVSPDELNGHLNTVIVAPLTTTVRSWPFRLTVTVMGKRSQIACDQLRAVDAQRLQPNVADRLKPKDRGRLLELLGALFAE